MSLSHQNITAHLDNTFLCKNTNVKLCNYAEHKQCKAALHTIT